VNLRRNNEPSEKAERSSPAAAANRARQYVA
jgi:hypothetical protein